MSRYCDRPFHSICRVDCTMIFKNPVIIEIVSPRLIRLYNTAIYWNLGARRTFFVDANYVMRKVRIVEPCLHRASFYLNCIRHEHIHSCKYEIRLQSLLHYPFRFFCYACNRPSIQVYKYIPYVLMRFPCLVPQCIEIRRIRVEFSINVLPVRCNYDLTYRTITNFSILVVLQNSRLYCSYNQCSTFLSTYYLFYRCVILSYIQTSCCNLIYSVYKTIISRSRCLYYCRSVPQRRFSHRIKISYSLFRRKLGPEQNTSNC